MFNVASMIVLIIILLRIFTNDSNLFLDMGSKHSINELGTFFFFIYVYFLMAEGGVQATALQ